MMYSSMLLQTVHAQQGLSPNEVTLHADNGGPMKGAMMRHIRKTRCVGFI